MKRHASCNNKFRLCNITSAQYWCSLLWILHEPDNSHFCSEFLHAYHQSIYFYYTEMSPGLSASPGPHAAVDSSPLLADGQEPEFAQLADLELIFPQKSCIVVLPCHSCALARHSKVLCRMFASTDRDGSA